jgi:hypothetical protein
MKETTFGTALNTRVEVATVVVFFVGESREHLKRFKGFGFF